jgi:hypothetical protein
MGDTDIIYRYIVVFIGIPIYRAGPALIYNQYQGVLLAIMQALVVQEPVLIDLWNRSLILDL